MKQVTTSTKGESADLFAKDSAIDILTSANLSKQEFKSHAPHYSLDDLDSVLRVLRGESVWRSNSEGATRLIHAFREKINPSQFCIPMASGSAALHTVLAYYVRKFGPRVLVPAYTWYAVPAAILNAGGVPYFVDISLPDFCLEEFSDEIMRNGKPSCAIVSHLFGIPALNARHLEWLRRNNIPLVEDCAQCITGRIDDHPVGRLGDVAVYSFNGSKHIPAGEGGMIATDEEEINSFANDFVMTVASPREAVVRRINSASEGWNYRLSAISASLSASLVHSLEERVKTASQAAQVLHDCLVRRKWLRIVGMPLTETRAYLGLPFLLEKTQSGLDIEMCRDVLFYTLRYAGFPTSVWVPEAAQESELMRKHYENHPSRLEFGGYESARCFARTHLVFATNGQMLHLLQNDLLDRVLDAFEQYLG